MPSDSQQGRVPSYRRHKPTGQAVVTLSGRDFYLGKWNTKASRAEYDRLIGEWLAAGRSLRDTAGDMTVAEVALCFWEFAKGYYRKDVVDATLPYLPPLIADMVRLQRLTGCRPVEVCAIRPCDVDTSGDVWTYRPESHKTEHHGCERIIFIGPKAQEILRLYLLRDKTAYCFVPAESERKRHALQRENRRSPMTPSQARRRPKRHPRRKPGDWYRSGAYLRAVHRAVELANRDRAEDDRLPQWSPNKLRHSAATEIRERFGLEAAQVTLGHATADVTQVYAERDMTLAAEIMRKIG